MKLIKVEGRVIDYILEIKLSRPVFIEIENGRDGGRRTVNVGSTGPISPDDARQLADALRRAADVAEGKSK